METWLKYTILLFLTVAGAAVVMPGKHHISVDDTSKTENVLSGSSLILHCCLNTSRSSKCRVSWFFKASGFNQTQMKSDLICTSTKKPKSKMCTSSCYNDTCNISDVNEANTGLYSCQVTIEIPILMINGSNETNIVVIPKEEIWWMWLLLGLSVILLILLIICAAQRSRCRRNTAEEPVYVNSRPMMNKQPSPQPGMLGDNLKTAPSQDFTLRAGRRYDEGNRRYKH